jgi:two-component system cell cycle response regulator
MTATILVVDDLPQNVEILCAKLASEYYNVIPAYSAKEALGLLSQNKVDIIILDVMMPEMDGIELCKILKKDLSTTHIPVIMVTALSDHQDKINGLEAGADEFLTKPINDIALFARVRFLSKMKQTIDELKLRDQTNLEMGITVDDMSREISEISIVVIEDDIVQFKNIYNILKKSNICSILTIDQGKSWDTIYSFNHPVDLVLISTQIEWEDPLRVFVKLKTRSNFQSSSFILMAHEEDFRILSKGFEMGVSDYILSPINQSELIARIRTQIQRKKYYDALKKSLELKVSMSIKDSMTNLYNKMYFDYHLSNTIRAFETVSSTFCIAMIDIDDFKNVNDSYGHQAGDKVIQEISRIINSQVRIVDSVARYGGEEFLILLKNTDLEYAILIAERIRSAVEKHEFIMLSGVKFRKTVSIGIAEYMTGETQEELIKKADLSLYKSKFGGKNQVRTINS